jgi:Flp pilus assembly protein TadD
VCSFGGDVMASPDSQAFTNAVIAYKSGNYAEAISLLHDELQRDPNDWTAMFYLAMCLASNKQSHEALIAFGKIRDLCPDPGLRQRAASAYFALNSIALKHNA